MNRFLPLSMTEVKEQGWQELDFILVTGDAYVDHPSFGTAIIGRVLEKENYKVGIIAQPNWQSYEDFTVFGRPRLAFLVSSGCIDSMVAHYSSLKRQRREDQYSPGGIPGKRPDRALIVYTSKIRQAYKDIPVILGGLEASLRRLSHYDYWSNSVRRSVLADAKADLLIYGMGEKPIIEIADRLSSGENIKDITDVRGTVYRISQKLAENTLPKTTIFLHPYEEASPATEVGKKSFAENFAASYKNTDPYTALPIAEKIGEQYIVQNKPSFPLSTKELDAVYQLPFTRQYHPSYKSIGGIPALQEIKFSITSARGCFGSCSFCAITYHQGRHISARSKDSIVNETKAITKLTDFKGYIHDVGGPTANFRIAPCEKVSQQGFCQKRCLAPTPCKNLKADHTDYIEVLKAVEKIAGVKKVFIRSGIRFDYLLLDNNVKLGKPGNFLEKLCKDHVSGQLKTAPEHISQTVLALMGKPDKDIYEKFKELFKKENNKLEKKQFLVPYFISAHPGSTLKDAIELALYLKREKFIPDQVQDFYPTPGTLSTCMYYTGMDPFTMKKIYIPSTEEEKRMQKALLHFHKPENYTLVKKALEKAGRKDLVGNHKDALISLKPPVGENSKLYKKQKKY